MSKCSNCDKQLSTLDALPIVTESGFRNVTRSKLAGMPADAPALLILQVASLYGDPNRAMSFAVRFSDPIHEVVRASVEGDDRTESSWSRLHPAVRFGCLPTAHNPLPAKSPVAAPQLPGQPFFPAAQMFLPRSEGSLLMGPLRCKIQTVASRRSMLQPWILAAHSIPSVFISDGEGGQKPLSCRT